MSKIDIKKLFIALDEELRLKLSSKIDQIYHPTAKGGETELNWIGLLRNYLPERYTVDSGFVVDHSGNISQQIDIIIYDRHFTPFIFRGENVVYIPAEGVYAVFEVKQKLNKEHCDYAQKKIESVKKLKRTSATVTHIQGQNKKEPHNIFGGILTGDCGSKTFFYKVEPTNDLSFIVSLNAGVKIFGNGLDEKLYKNTILALFLLKLIEKLRLLGSVPALDVNQYLAEIGKIKK